MPRVLLIALLLTAVSWSTAAPRQVVVRPPNPMPVCLDSVISACAPAPIRFYF